MSPEQKSATQALVHALSCSQVAVNVGLACVAQAKCTAVCAHDKRARPTPIPVPQQAHRKSGSWRGTQGCLSGGSPSRQSVPQSQEVCQLTTRSAALLRDLAAAWAWERGGPGSRGPRALGRACHPRRPPPEPQVYGCWTMLPQLGADPGGCGNPVGPGPYYQVD